MTRMPSFQRTALAAALLGLTALAGCSKPEPDAPVEMENSAVEALPTAEATADPLPTPAVTAEPAPAALPDANSAAAEAETVAPDAQMLEDADATGMTARVTRDEAPANDQEAQ